MTWQPRQLSDGSGYPWLEWELPHGMSYGVEDSKGGYTASLVDSGGTVLWSRKCKTVEAAKEACALHALDMAGEFLGVKA